jgi:dolichyl-phosphate beta-glucosyltransferase
MINIEKKFPLISLIIPSFNAATILKNQLPGMIGYLKFKNINYEIFIVDDGTKDNGYTKKVADDFNCIYLKNEKNLGKGSCVRKGILNSRGEYIIYTDADIPFDYDAIEKFIYYMDFKEFDMVIGDRTLPESHYYEEMSFKRNLSSRLFTFIIGRFVTGGFNDTQCGLKGFKSSVAMDIFSVARINGFAFDVEVLYIALKRNYDIKKLPVKLRLKNNSGSTVKIFHHSVLMLFDIFRIKFLQLKGIYKKSRQVI